VTGLVLRGRRRMRWPVTAGAALLLATGCSGSVPGTTAGSTAGSTATPTGLPPSPPAPAAGGAAARVGDPCDLVPRAQLEAALGGALGPPRTSDNGSQRSCDYLMAAGVAATLQLRERFHLAPEDFAAGRASVALGRPVADVPGLGQEAYAADLPGGTRLVVARTGDRELLVSTTGAAVTRERAVAVARLALTPLAAVPG